MRNNFIQTRQRLDIIVIVSQLIIEAEILLGSKSRLDPSAAKPLPNVTILAF